MATTKSEGPSPATLDNRNRNRIVIEIVNSRCIERPQKRSRRARVLTRRRSPQQHATLLRSLSQDDQSLDQTVRDNRRSKSLGRLLFLRGFSAGIHLPPASYHHVHGGSILHVHHPCYKVPSSSQEPTHAHGKARGGRGLLATRRS